MLYTSLQCKNCNKDIILLSEQLIYFEGDVRCPYCHSNKVHVNNASDNLNELMKHRSYKRVGGYIKQCR